MGRSHFDVDDLLRNIIELESLERARKHRIGSKKDQKPASDQRKNSSFSSQRVSTSTQGNNLTQQTDKNYRDSKISSANRECYRCHEKGQIARDCTVRPQPKYYNCSEIGHIPPKCRKPKSLNRAEANIIVPNSGEDSYKKYEKKIKIGEFEFLAFTDPGSSDCLIRKSAVMRSGFKIIDCKRN